MTPKIKAKTIVPYLLIISLLIAGVFGYVNYNKIIDELKTKLLAFDNNKKEMEQEFTQINDEYHSMMATMSEKDQILIEKLSELQNIKFKLEGVLNKKNITENDLAEAKTLIALLKSELRQSKIIEGLKAKSDSLVYVYKKSVKEFEIKIKNKEQKLAQNKITIKKNKETIVKNKEIIKRGATLRLINFSIKGVNVKASGREVETDKARKADKLRVSFDVNDNNISETGEKELYLAIYDADKKLTHFRDATSGTLKLLNGNMIEYTDYIKFMYEKGLPKKVKFDWENDDFKKGEYKIEVYQNGYLIGSETKSFR